MKNKKTIFIVCLVLLVLILLLVIFMNNKNRKINLSDFLGTYQVGLGPDGYYNIKITGDNEKINFDWTYGPFNETEYVVNVKSYKVEDNKIKVTVEENETEQTYILFKSNGKIYLTMEEIENQEDSSYFPSEMEKK